jgi:hypothetical protein
VPDESVSLQFVDLLYAVPVADLAVRVSTTHLRHVTASGWTDLAVPLVALTFGWIGHHANRKKLPGVLSEARDSGRQFLTLRFCQFVVEILIIVPYFAIGTRCYLPSGAGIGHPAETWKAAWLTVTFGLYVAWDLLDLGITKRLMGKPELSDADRGRLKRWVSRDWWRVGVTSSFFVLFLGGLWLAWARNYHPGARPYHSVVVFDLVTIFVLYVYRVVQELVLERVLDDEEGSGAEGARVRA